jgi:hypothetical protein
MLTLYLLTVWLLMVVGGHGQTMARVQYRVVKEHRSEIGRAMIPHQPMEELHAKAPITKRSFVMAACVPTSALVGVRGVISALVQYHVVMDTRLGTVLVKG